MRHLDALSRVEMRLSLPPACAASRRTKAEKHNGEIMQEPLDEVELTARRLLSVFWLFVWRGLVGGAVVGLVLGIIIAIVFRIAGIERDVWANALSFALCLIGGWTWSVGAMHMALTKRYRDFRIAIVGL
jgi:hypothetical protein